MRIEAGLVIGNRFRLLSLVGVDAFGSLWRAADHIPGKKVEISIGDVELDATQADAFKQEMNTAAALRHRSIARIYAADGHPGHVAWIASEIVAGDSLDSVLEWQSLSTTQALTMISELAGVLAEVHALGLAHGALTPQTVLLQAMRPALIGLGRARLAGSKQVMDVAYSSPESLASQEYNAASDVWSLGVLLFRCVTGRLPFSARTTAALEVETRRINRLLSTIEDASIRLIIAECFALAPTARPSAGDLADRVRQLARELEQERRTPEAAAPIVSPPPAPVESVPPPTVSSPPPTFSSPPPVESVPRPTRSSPPPMESAVEPLDDELEEVKEPIESLAPIALSTPPPLPKRRAPEPESAIAAAPVNDNDNDLDAVDFRPRRLDPKLVIGIAAAAAIFVELIVATREPPNAPPVAARYESEPLRAPEPPPPAPVMASSEPVTIPSAAVTASASSSVMIAAPKPAPVATIPKVPKVVKPPPPPAAKTGEEEDPYQ